VNRYEGLNLPQLLELMHELVLPEPVSRLPEGPGWWLIAGWLATMLALVLGRYVSGRRRNRYRRQAAAALAEIARSADANPAAAAAGIAILLKRPALAAYPRERVASLSGADWARSLRESAGNDAIIDNAADRLAHAAYQPDADGRELVKAAARWIRVHRA